MAVLGHSVTCFDIDDEKIERIKQGDLPIYEAGLYELIHDTCENNRLTLQQVKKKHFMMQNLYLLQLERHRY